MPWTTPFEELKKTIRSLVWVSVVFAIVMTVIALTSITLSSYVVYQHTIDNKATIKRSQDTVVALCREINDNNLNFMVLALDVGIPYHQLQFLQPKNCNPAKLRKRYGAIE